MKIFPCSTWKNASLSRASSQHYKYWLHLNDTLQNPHEQSGLFWMSDPDWVHRSTVPTQAKTSWKIQLHSKQLFLQQQHDSPSYFFDKSSFSSRSPHRYGVQSKGNSATDDSPSAFVPLFSHHDQCKSLFCWWLLGINGSILKRKVSVHAMVVRCQASNHRVRLYMFPSYGPRDPSSQAPEFPRGRPRTGREGGREHKRTED